MWNQIITKSICDIILLNMNKFVSKHCQIYFICCGKNIKSGASWPDIGKDANVGISSTLYILEISVTFLVTALYNSDEINLIQSVIEKAIYDSPDPYKKKCAENHLRAFMLARYAVMRKGEILSMPLRNLLIDEGVIQITEVPEIPWTPQTRQERIIPISPELNKFFEQTLPISIAWMYTTS